MLIFWLIAVFVLGAVIGSFLNVCIVRLPLEKSILWPGSHCGHCYQPVAWRDNVPLLSYWLLGGKCRTCGAVFSSRYFQVELLTAVGFVVLFQLLLIDNINRIPGLGLPAVLGDIPPEGWIVFAHRAVLFSLLVVVSFCDLDRRWIPLSVTITGTCIGLAFSTLFPWPWPLSPDRIPPVGMQVPGWGPFVPPLADPRAGDFIGLQGLCPWPVWWPLPAALPPGEWYTGLATGLAGALVGTFLLRAIRFIFTAALGKEALGLGDADLMMMAGSFLGWPVVVVAFFLAVFPALVLGLVQMFLSGDRSLPFGPSLALSVLGTSLAWSSLGPQLCPVFYSLPVLTFLVVGCGIFLILAGLIFRLFRRRRSAIP